MIRPSMPAQRLVPAVGVIVAIVVAGFLTSAPAGAGTLTKETETFGPDPYGASFECDGFSAHYVGHDEGTIITWFDANGDPVRQQGKIIAVETDTNDLTGASVVVRTQLNVHIDYVRDIQRLTGIRNLSTDPGRGVVIQSVGNRVSSASDPDVLVAVHGPADDINLGGGFCEALSG
jgi:hypothetical protein